MFDWFKSETGSAGLERMRTEFGQMLDSGRHVFDTAANALLGGTDLDVIRKDLFETDKRINKAERQIRSEIVVHASVHGAAEFPPCLVLMSIVKDAERVGDYGKDIFALAEIAPQRPDGEHLDSLAQLKDRISRLMAAVRETFDSNDKDRATDLIVEAKQIEDLCIEQINSLISSPGDNIMAPSYVLMYRYFKRATAHMGNVASSLVQPVHKIDFTSKIVSKAEAKSSEPHK